MFCRANVSTVVADRSTERIKANFAIQRLSEEDNKALDDLEIPKDEGRSIDFVDGKYRRLRFVDEILLANLHLSAHEAWGVQLWQK